MAAESHHNLSYGEDFGTFKERLLNGGGRRNWCENPGENWCQNWRKNRPPKNARLCSKMTIQNIVRTRKKKLVPFLLCC